LTHRGDGRRAVGGGAAPGAHRQRPRAATRARPAPRCTDSVRGAQIATDFILHAPFGELKEVVADVQVLCGGEAVLADKLPVGPGSRRRCAERAPACPHSPPHHPLTVTPPHTMPSGHCARVQPRAASSCRGPGLVHPNLSTPVARACARTPARAALPDPGDTGEQGAPVRRGRACGRRVLRCCHRAQRARRARGRSHRQHRGSR